MRCLRVAARAALAGLLAACAPGIVPMDHPTSDTPVAMPDGRRLRVRVFGTAPDTVLVLHGGPTLGSNYLVATLGALTQRHTVVLYDQRGRGASDAEPDSARLTVAQDLADLEAVRTALRLGPTTVLGDHYGAALAVLFAQRQPTAVRRLAITTPYVLSAEMMSALGIGVGDAARFARWSAAVRARRDTVGTPGYCREFWGLSMSPMQVADSAVVDRLAPSICDQPAEALRRMEDGRRLLVASMLQSPLRSALHDVRVPTLVIGGNTNPRLQDVAREWNARIPTAQLLEIEGWPQFPWVSAPGAVFEALETFLDGGWPARTAPALPEARRMFPRPAADTLAGT